MFPVLSVHRLCQHPVVRCTPGCGLRDAWARESCQVYVSCCRMIHACMVDRLSAVS